MSWNIGMTGTRDEIESAVTTTADVPDSVKAFVANAGAYYDEDDQLEFSSSGHAHEGKIANCEIRLAMTANRPPSSQLPAEPEGPPHAEHH